MYALIRICFYLLLIILGKCFSEYELNEGLCAQSIYINCPTITQMKGICCRPKRSSKLKYFKNSCLACAANCETYYYKSKNSTDCS